MSIGKRIGLIIILWFVLSVVLIGILVSNNSKEKMKSWNKKDKDLAFRNARILCLLLAIAIGLLV